MHNSTMCRLQTACKPALRYANKSSSVSELPTATRHFRFLNLKSSMIRHHKDKDQPIETRSNEAEGARGLDFDLFRRRFLPRHDPMLDWATSSGPEEYVPSQLPAWFLSSNVKCFEELDLKGSLAGFNQAKQRANARSMLIPGTRFTPPCNLGYFYTHQCPLPLLSAL